MAASSSSHVAMPRRGRSFLHGLGNSGIRAKHRRSGLSSTSPAPVPISGSSFTVIDYLPHTCQLYFSLDG
ncbi:hypothetical protein LZ30DRAFT_696045 [Colletotrichum cereale]|nr:hypothetical protein LZ30DRAFT_696045 [Colletotrichum cereale]